VNAIKSCSFDEEKCELRESKLGLAYVEAERQYTVVIGARLISSLTTVMF